jgi:beta-glucosidase-like glycosyl hydrolase
MHHTVPNSPLAGVTNVTNIKRALGRKTTFGTLTAEDVERSARRVLRTSFLLGELDGPSTVSQQTWGLELVDSAAHRALALRAARSSIVLLENSGALPLEPTATGVAFIGPHCHSSIAGKTQQDSGSVPRAVRQQPCRTQWRAWLCLLRPIRHWTRIRTHY